jgi:DNA-directed RNA polymerase beta' subunit
MMAMEVVPMPYKTFRFNLAATTSWNADFDGDEMNVHAVQSYESEVELRRLSATPLNIITAQESKPVIGIKQDSLIAVYLMTRKQFALSRRQFCDISMKGERPDGTPLWTPNRIKTIQQVLKKFGKSPDIFNGKGLISLYLPEDFFYEKKNDSNPEEPIVKIYQGVLVEGTFDKSIVGNAHGSIIQILNKEYGSKVTANFIDNTQFIGSAWLMVHGFSVGLEDCMITSEESVTAIKDTLTQSYMKAEGIEQTTQNPGIREIRVTGALSQAKDIGMKIAKDAMRPDNNFLVTVRSGAKGDFFNIAQITGLLGQQNLEGKRVAPTLNHGKRTIPHYPMGEMDKEREYESRGFVKNSFIHGLSPEEFFFHAMSGREGVCDTAMSTAKSGYIQRKIVKVCEDIQVQYDNTVRDSSGKIYQFVYGQNGYDPTKTILVDGKPQMCDVARLANRLNMCYENKIENTQVKEEVPEISVEFVKKSKPKEIEIESYYDSDISEEEKDEEEDVEIEDEEEPEKEEEDVEIELEDEEEPEEYSEEDYCEDCE